MLSKPSPLVEPGTRVRISQDVRIGAARWRTFVVGTVEADGARPIGGMEMGTKAHYTFQPTIRLRLDDGEVTVVTVDDQTRLEVLPPV
ncbi:MAG: hypothetical protein KatS3mg108_1870 [Isosphaeraceae bacterium]|jgi:hypothetical protein|nr:MAG: hypothetical protein KatS3mg108_1870 [Isosphaeraceae bacterium]